MPVSGWSTPSALALVAVGRSLDQTVGVGVM